VNDKAAVGLDFAEFVGGFAPIGGAIGRLAGRYDQWSRISISRHLVSLVLVDLLVVSVPVYVGRGVTNADAAAENGFLRGDQSNIV